METCHILPIGPSSTGKTTLVCSIIDALRTLFADKKGISIQIDNEDAVNACVHALRTAKGELPDKLLQPTSEASSCTVRAGSTAGLLGKVLSKPALELVFHDYPGHLLEDLPEFTRTVTDLGSAEVLLVPVDATLIMEADSDQKEVAAQSLHKLTAIEEILVEWEKRRAKTAGGGLVLFVPVRCEQYFADNGMQADPDAAQKLQDRIRTRFFSNIIDILTFFGQNTDCLYVPVDTIGRCQLKQSQWDVQTPSFAASFVAEGTPAPMGSDLIALFILDYCTRRARQTAPARALADMEKTVDGLIDACKGKSASSRARRLC